MYSVCKCDGYVIVSVNFDNFIKAVPFELNLIEENFILDVSKISNSVFLSNVKFLPDWTLVRRTLRVLQKNLLKQREAETEQG